MNGVPVGGGPYDGCALFILLVPFEACELFAFGPLCPSSCPSCGRSEGLYPSYILLMVLLQQFPRAQIIGEHPDCSLN